MGKGVPSRPLLSSRRLIDVPISDGSGGGVSVLVMVAVLTLLGRFLYRLLLAVSIVWLIGLIVSLFVSDGSGGGVSVLVP